MNLAHEKPGDELEADAALAAIETKLRSALPDFHLYGHVKALTVSKAPRGVFVDVTFSRRRGIGVQRVRGIVSRAWAESLCGQLRSVLDA